MRTRPGNARSRGAISVAVSATLRIGAGNTPIPTDRYSLLHRAIAAAEIPPEAKQSSHTHNSSSPAASAARAAAASFSGGYWGRNTQPTRGGGFGASRRAPSGAGTLIGRPFGGCSLDPLMPGVPALRPKE